MHLLLLAHTAKRYRIAAVNNDFWFLFGKDVIFTIYSKCRLSKRNKISFKKDTQWGPLFIHHLAMCINFSFRYELCVWTIVGERNCVHKKTKLMTQLPFWAVAHSLMPCVCLHDILIWPRAFMIF